MSDDPKDGDSTTLNHFYLTLAAMKLVSPELYRRITERDEERIRQYIESVVVPLERELDTVEAEYGAAVADRIFYGAFEDMLRDIGWTEEAIENIRRKPRELDS